MTLAHQSRWEGPIVGLIAYASVVVFYSAFDLFAGHGVLYTVGLLGGAVFRGLRGAELMARADQLDVVAILLYNGVHLVACLALGIVFDRLVADAERDPAHSYVAVFVIAAGLTLTTIAIGVSTSGIRPVMPWWSIAAANWLALIVAGAYLLRRHRTLWRPFVPR